MRARANPGSATPRSASSTMTARQPECSTMYATSGAVSLGLIGTETRPALARPQAISQYSRRFPSMIATRSPVRSPAASMACASREERSLRLAYVSDLSPSMTAVAEGVATANSRIPLAMLSSAPFVRVPIASAPAREHLEERVLRIPGDAGWNHVRRRAELDDVGQPLIAGQAGADLGRRAGQRQGIDHGIRDPLRHPHLVSSSEGFQDRTCLLEETVKLEKCLV